MMIRTALLLGCIILAPTGNLLLKWGMSESGSIAEAQRGIVQYYASVFTKPQILVGAVIYLCSALMWMAVLSMMDISVVYPMFISAAFVIVTVAAALLFGEHINAVRILGIAIVIVGLLVVSQSTRWG